MDIIDIGSHTFKKFRNAYYSCNEGEYSGKVTNAQISKVLKAGMRIIGRTKNMYMQERFETAYSVNQLKGFTRGV